MRNLIGRGLALCLSLLLLTGCQKTTVETIPEGEEKTTAYTLAPQQTRVQTTAAPETTTVTMQTTLSMPPKQIPATQPLQGTLAVEEVAVPETTTAVPTIGTTGLTAEEWVQQAQTIYAFAAKVWFSYFGDASHFETDPTDRLEEDPRYVRITNYDTDEEAAEDYYYVFAYEGHEHDFDDFFKTSQGKLYGLCGVRGKDISYQKSTVTELSNATDKQLVFGVESVYTDLDTEDDDTVQTTQTTVTTAPAAETSTVSTVSTAPAYDWSEYTATSGTYYANQGEAGTKKERFTMLYERDSWRIGQFSMPY